MVPALLLCAILPATAHATFPGQNGKILFTRWVNGKPDLYAINADGSGLAPITNTADAYEFDASASPDGKRIAFQRYGGTAPAGTLTMDVGGGNEQTVIPDHAYAMPVFTADGQRLVYSDTTDIWSVKLDGTDPLNLTNEPVHSFDNAKNPNTEPSVSSTGRIAYVYLQLTHDPSGCPNGSYLAYQHIWAMNGDGTGRAALTTGDYTADHTPRFSPDGTKIVFWRETGPPCGGTASLAGLFTVPAAGGNETQLAANGEQGVFSPDGTQIAYVAFNDGIWVMNADGTNPHRILADTAAFISDWAAIVPPPTCGGKQATVYGTNGPDVLTGTDGPDVIAGLGGNDTISGLGGDDVICGGGGSDTIDGGDGADTIDGEDGGDTIVGGAGVDTITGGDGGDTINGGDAGDTIDGGAGVDTIHGDAGNDTLKGGDGGDIIHGGDGSDGIFGGEGDDVIFGDADTDILNGDAGGDILYGGANPVGDLEILNGDEGDDSLYGEDGPDLLSGGSGDDHLDGGSGTDQLWGGGGTDLVDGGDGNDALYGNSELDLGPELDQGDTLDGGSGNDQVHGNNGDDTLFGETGDDTLDGGPGKDALLGGDDSDTLKARDGEADALIDCGAGLDPATEHDLTGDPVPVDCEGDAPSGDGAPSGGAAPPGDTTGVGTATGDSGAGAGTGVGHIAIGDEPPAPKVSPSGNVSVGTTVACPGVGASCQVVAEILGQLPFGPRAVPAAGRTVPLGGARFTVAAGAEKRVTAKLSHKGLALLRARRSLKVRIRITVTQLGATRVVRTLRVTLRAPRRA